MALEAVVFPQDHLFGGYCLKDLCDYDFGSLMLELGDEDQRGMVENMVLSPPENAGSVAGEKEAKVVVERKKRRRARSCKNKEEVENQRMTHIAVERNRRKLMNEYLAVLRSIMPPAYIQRGDQASIVGGAINYVKELEHLLQTLEAQRRIKLRSDLADQTGAASSSPFTDFFSFPQYSSTAYQATSIAAISNTGSGSNNTAEAMAKNQSAVADIEVTMVESHANLKVLSKRRPKQLLKMVAGLQDLRFGILHLNVTTVEDMAMYSFSLKVDDGCQFRSVDDIATTVHLLVGKIKEEIESESESVCD